MTRASELSAPARRAIFEAMVAMAWADTRLDRHEILAVRAAGCVLSLPDDALDALDAGPPRVVDIARDDLDATERELVYLCAAWTSVVDDHESADEDALLRELREALGISGGRATELRDDARALHIDTDGSTPWYAELEALIARASDAMQKSA